MIAKKSLKKKTMMIVMKKNGKPVAGKEKTMKIFNSLMVASGLLLASPMSLADLNAVARTDESLPAPQALNTWERPAPERSLKN